MKHESLRVHRSNTTGWHMHRQVTRFSVKGKRSDPLTIYLHLYWRLNWKKNHSQACQIFKTLTMTGIDMNMVNMVILFHYDMIMSPMCVWHHLSLWNFKLANFKGKKLRHHNHLHHKSMATSNQFRTSSALALKSYYTCIKCGTISGNWSQKGSKTIY